MVDDGPLVSTHSHTSHAAPQTSVWCDHPVALHRDTRRTVDWSVDRDRPCGMRLALLCLLVPGLMTAADVIADLPASPGIASDDAGSRWRMLPITGIDAARDVLVQVTGRPVTVARALVARDDEQAAAALPALLERALAAGVDTTTLRLERGLLTGVHLRGSDVLVLDTAVLRRASSVPATTNERRTAVTTAATALVAALERGGTTPPAQIALRRLLTTLDQTTVEDEEFPPALVRRLIGHGWLDDLLGTTAELAPLREALQAAAKLQVAQRWSGDDTVLEDLRDAFGRRVLTLRSPTACARVQEHAASSYDRTPTRMVVQRFPLGSDPLGDAPPIAAECWWGRVRIVEWNATDGLRADAAAWRLALADDGPGVDDDAVVDWRPPHVVLSNADGAVTALCTAHGVLRPASSDQSEERERFLTEAAKQCPDAAHLDLIGQYLFAYVHDSPDPKAPGLIGVRGTTGEIHQTIGQTIATVCGGVMRGDCDDLSEIYHTLLTRQGHLPQVFNLPRHAACGWSLKQGDRWTTQVLHTGQPLAFHGDTLEESLAQVFGHFDQQNTDNGTLVHVLLRFAGENIRSQWRLGSRIMRDGDYARTMIDVQRDWYYHTFAQAILTMRGMITDGDDASANLSELAGLYRRTGEWRAAIAAERASLTRIEDATARLDGRLTLISLMVRGDLDADAQAEARALLQALDQDLAKNQPALKQRMIMSVYRRLDHTRHGDLVRELLMKHLFPTVETRRLELTRWARTRFDARAWANQAIEERSQAATVIGATIGDLERPSSGLGDADRQRLLAFSERWLTDLAFLDTGERDDVMASYATVGRLAGAVLGNQVLDALITQAKEPVAWSNHHAHRVAGLPQLTRDLPWIRISVPFWSGRLSSLLGKDDVLLDEPAALELIRHLRAAIAACQRLDIDPAGQDHTLRWVALIEALIRRNEDDLRTALRAYAERRDRRSDEMVTDNLEAMAQHLPPTWFRRVLALWDETAATKPGYFAIAWGCAARGDIAQALEAGALAARRFSDDPAFVAEYAYLQRVLSGGEAP